MTPATSEPIRPNPPFMIQLAEPPTTSPTTIHAMIPMAPSFNGLTRRALAVGRSVHGADAGIQRQRTRWCDAAPVGGGLSACAGSRGRSCDVPGSGQRDVTILARV